MSDDKKVIFSMQKLSKTYSSSDKQVLKNIYLSFFYGAKIGILGLNGSGKSSLLRIIAGEDRNYQGDVVFQPGYTVGYLEQEPILDDSKTVIEVVKEGVAETMAVLDEFNKINDSFGLPEVYEDADKMQQLMDRQADLQDKIDALGAWEIDTKLEIAMDALRTPEGDTPIKNLSGGERRRVALCRLLLKQPDILLLDEPTNHLDAESVLWLEQHLAQYSGTVIAVTHDRYFLDNVAGWILELDRGEGIPWKGNYSSWLDQKSSRMAQEEKVASKRRKTLERELDWVRQGSKGRQTKQKARLQNYDKLLNEDQKELDEKLSTVKFKKEYIEFADLVSNYLGEFNGVHVRLTDHQPVFRTREEMISDQISKFDSSPIIVLTDDINHKMFKNKNIQFLDDIIVDNFSKEFMSLPIHSEIAYGAVCALIMAKSKDFVGTFGSTFTGYIHRIRNQNDLPQNFKFIGMEKPEFGSPYSWNDIYAGTVKSIEFEWPESRLMV